MVETHKAYRVAPADAMQSTLRVGLWIAAGNCYSGGRIMLTMYALALARAGAEVWFITDGHLAWRDDYEFPINFHIARIDEPVQGEPYPEDLDLLVTDCRGKVAARCVEFKLAHPDTPLAVVAFETPNWAEKFDKQLGAQMRREDFCAIERHADMLMAISREGARHLAEFYNDGKPIEVIYPSINTEAIDRAEPHKTTRPYAVFCGRPVRHKHMEIAVQAICNLPISLDLIILGAGNTTVQYGDRNHDCRRRHDVGDVGKFSLMKGAAVVLAPSTFEGFGLVPGESLCCQTPVVAYDLPVLREAYGDDVTYAKHNNAADFCARVRDAVTGPRPDVRAAAARVRKRFGLESLPERVQAHPYHAVTRTRLSVNMICYATPSAVVEASIKSVYDVAAEINIAYGPVPYWKDFPEGGTLERIRGLADPQHKIRIEARDVWADKREMWAWCGRAQTGNYQLITGADMIWVDLDRWLSKGYRWATPRWINFWHSLDWWVHGPQGPSRWGEKLEPFGSLCRHRLFGVWRHSYRFDVHTEPVDFCGRRLWSVEENRRAAEETPETACYHLGHLLPDMLMTKKHAYYAERDGDGEHGGFWRKWNGGAGPCGDGIVARVDWQLPQAVLDWAKITGALAREAAGD